MGRRPQDLTDSDREVICSLYTGSLTVTQIAKNLSRGRSTVSNVVLKFKLLLGKSPLATKIQKNNVFFRVKTVRCRRIVIV